MAHTLLFTMLSRSRNDVLVHADGIWFNKIDYLSRDWQRGGREKCDEMSAEMYRNGENYWPFNNFYIWHLRDILIATSSELLLLTPDRPQLLFCAFCFCFVQFYHFGLFAFCRLGIKQTSKHIAQYVTLYVERIVSLILANMSGKGFYFRVLS